MSAPWYYIEGGERCGPISTIELLKRVSKGQVHKSSPVRREGFAGWIRAGSVPGLFEVSPPSASREIPAPGPITADEMSITSEMPNLIDLRVVTSGRLMHIGLWSTVALVAIICGCLIWSHETEKRYKAQIVSLCKEVQSAIRNEDDEAADLAYGRLIHLIDHREIPWISIAAEVKKTRQWFLPVADRIDRARDEREAQAVAEANSRASASNQDDLTARADAVESRIVEKLIRGETDFSDVRQDVDDMLREARSRVDAMNRRPGQAGYSLQERRDVTTQMLINQGESPSEARITMQLMEERGLLPDPPRK